MTLLYTTSTRPRLVLGATASGPRLDLPVSRDLFIALQDLDARTPAGALGIVTRILEAGLLPLGPVREPEVSEDERWVAEQPRMAGERLYQP